jgi:hypothetical protein
LTGMPDDPYAKRQFAIVRDANGAVVHIHEVISVDKGQEMDESTLLQEALDSAKAANPDLRSGLTAAMSSLEEANEQAQAIPPLGS